MDYRTIMLGEVGTTAFRAVHIGQNGDDRLVYFATAESMNRAIAAGTHRAFNPDTDAHLAVQGSPSDAATGEQPPENEPTSNDEPNGDQSTNDTPDAGNSTPTTFEQPPQPKAQKTVARKPAAKKAAGPSAMDLAVDDLPEKERGMIETATRTTRSYWNSKFKKLAASFPASDVNDPKTKEKEKFMGLLNEFADADSMTAKTQAVAKMLKAKYIAIHEDPNVKKVYFETNRVGMDQEFLSRNRSIAAKEMSAMMHTMVESIAASTGTQVKKYGKTHFGRKADAVGKHHEYGVAYFLQQMRGTKRGERTNDRDRKLDELYGLIRKDYRGLSGNDYKQHKFNQETAQAIKDQFVPEGAVITDARVVGRAMRHDSLDPTDLVLTYRKDGQQTKVNISLKTLVAPNSITLRTLGTNSGMSIGTMLGGKEGQAIVNYYNQNIAQPEWGNPDETEPLDIDPTLLGDDDEGSAYEGPANESILDMEEFPPKDPDMSDPEIAAKVEYTRFMANHMARLQHTSSGQAQLQSMWKDLHGCYRNVSMIITNSISGQTNLAGPQNYCGPGKLEIGYHSRRITLRMMEKEDNSSYLEFNFRKRKNKDGTANGQIQVLRKFGSGVKIGK